MLGATIEYKHFFNTGYFQGSTGTVHSRIATAHYGYRFTKLNRFGLFVKLSKKGQ